MSKVFSLIGLETSTGIRDIGIMGGISEMEDIQSSQLYRELVEDCGGSKYIEIVVKSYLYGEGNPETADMEDLKWLDTHPEFVESDKVAPLKTASFTILHPDQGMQLNM